MPETLEELFEMMVHANTQEELDEVEKAARLWRERHPEDEIPVSRGMESVYMTRSALEYNLADSDSE